jgi:hypothetical protein
MRKAMPLPMIAKCRNSSSAPKATRRLPVPDRLRQGCFPFTFITTVTEPNRRRNNRKTKESNFRFKVIIQNTLHQYFVRQNEIL